MPEDFSFQLYHDDLERLEWYIEERNGNACRSLALQAVGRVDKTDPFPMRPYGLR